MTRIDFLCLPFLNFLNSNKKTRLMVVNDKYYIGEKLDLKYITYKFLQESDFETFFRESKCKTRDDLKRCLKDLGYRDNCRFYRVEYVQL